MKHNLQRFLLRDDEKRLFLSASRYSSKVRTDTFSSSINRPLFLSFFFGPDRLQLRDDHHEAHAMECESVSAGSQSLEPDKS